MNNPGLKTLVSPWVNPLTQAGEKKMDDLIEEGDNLYHGYKKLWGNDEPAPDDNEVEEIVA